MTTCAEWEAKRDAAEAALHTVMMGGSVSFIRDGEAEVHYTPANAPDLAKYVQWLQSKVDGCNGVRTGGGTVLWSPIDC